MLAELARGKIRSKREALVEDLTGRYGELARTLLDQATPWAQIERLTVRIDELIAQIPAAAAPGVDNSDQVAGSGGTGSGAAVGGRPFQ